MPQYARGRCRVIACALASADGNYVESDTSPNFPEIAIAQIIPNIVERAWQVGSYQALEEFENAIAQQK